MPHTSSRRSMLTPLCALLVSLMAFTAGCADATSPSANAKAVIGAPCDNDSACDSALCVANVCEEGSADAGVVDAGEASDALNSDVLLSDAADSTELDLDNPKDTTEPEDTGPTDVVAEADATADDMTSEDVTTDIVDWDSIKSDCEELGIADDWKGTFTGMVEHDLTIPENFGTVPDEALAVAGELSFSIQCVDSKFQVDGILDGFADFGSEKYPFTLNLKGYYNPATKKLSADIVDGKVLILVVEVYFEGDFAGELQTDADGNDSFTGSWAAEATGTNAEELVQGTALALGSWEASPFKAGDESTP